MTRTSLALTGLLVLSLIAGAAPAVAQTGPQTESADLAISQPHYADGEIQRTTENGTVVYQGSTVPLELAPQNFDAANVVDYGVETEGGGAQLSYNRDFDQFVFNADADGTYQLYWSVERQVQVQNESGNGTHIETRGQRYTASIRLSNTTEMIHQPAGSLQETRKKAANWDEWNATVAETQDVIGTSLPVKLGLVEAPRTAEAMQGMVNAYLTFRAPLHMLTGNYTQIVTLVGMTLGGWLFVATVILPLLGVILALAYRSNRFETTEADEGRLSKRVGEQQRKEDRTKLANTTHNDIWEGDDYLPGAMREEGEDPLTAVSSLFTKFRPRSVFHARLQAMDTAGWTAVVDRRSSDADSGGGEIIQAHLAREDALGDDMDTVGLDVAPDDALLDALDWNQQEIWDEFDLADADLDPSAINETPVESHTLDEVLGLTDLDMRQFDDDTQAAQAMIEFLEYIREHEFTDQNGEIDSLRYALEHHLRAANVLEDRFHLPVDAYTGLFEMALLQHDAGAEAEQTLQDIRDGAYA